MYQNEKYLMHYGVKGMKWGVRRYQNKDGSRIRKEVKSHFSRRVRNNEYSTYRRSKTMSDDELRAANKRYQLERQYRDNVRNDSRDGRTYAEKILDRSGSVFIGALIGASAAGAGAAVGKKVLATAGPKIAKHIVLRR